MVSLERCRVGGGGGVEKWRKRVLGKLLKWSRCPVLPGCKRRHSARTCVRGTPPVARTSPTGKMAALRAVTGAITAARTLRARPAMATRVARVGARPPASLDSTSAGSLGRVIARPLPGPIRPLAASPRARRSLSTIPSAGHHPDAIPSGISDPHSFEVRLPIPPPRWAPIHSVARAHARVRSRPPHLLHPSSPEHRAPARSPSSPCSCTGTRVSPDSGTRTTTAPASTSPPRSASSPSSRPIPSRFAAKRSTFSSPPSPRCGSIPTRDWVPSRPLSPPPSRRRRRAWVCGRVRPG